ncbi:MAG: TetR/AcrR family transcriptional regulator [Deltaproteobacteria bacterium]
MAISARRRKAKDSKKNAILRVARSLFLEKGFTDVTVESIARGVDISKGAVYLHFNSKDEIYVHVLAREIDVFCKEVDAIPLSTMSVNDALKQFSRMYVDFFVSKPEIFRIFIGFMLYLDKKPRHHESLYELVGKTNKAVNVLSIILAKGVSEGVFSATIDKEATRNAIWGMLNGAILLYLFVVKEEQSKKLIKRTVDNGLIAVLDGIKKC